MARSFAARAAKVRRRQLRSPAGAGTLVAAAKCTGKSTNGAGNPAAHSEITFRDSSKWNGPKTCGFSSSAAGFRAVLCALLVFTDCRIVRLNADKNHIKIYAPPSQSAP